MFDINAVVVLSPLNCIVRGVDGLPGSSHDKTYRSWLKELVCEHDVIMGENAYRKFSSHGNILPCERMVVLAKPENIQSLEKAARDNSQRTIFVSRASLLGGGTSYAEIIKQKRTQHSEKRRKMFVVGGPHTLYRLAANTNHLYLTRTDGVGDKYLDGEYHSFFPKEIKGHGHYTIFGK